jgi:hypothetical protein
MMMKSILFLSVFMSFLTIWSGCGSKDYKTEYMPLVKELHEIECRQLSGGGISAYINDTSVYAFRSKAFDLIMTKKPDAKLIAHYEELNQRLAALEYFMDPVEKKIYQDDFKEVYLKQCE